MTEKMQSIEYRDMTERIDNEFDVILDEQSEQIQNELTCVCINPCFHCESLVLDGLQDHVNEATMTYVHITFDVPIKMPLCSNHYYERIEDDAEANREATEAIV